jgi:hypothetical protein
MKVFSTMVLAAACLVPSLSAADSWWESDRRDRDRYYRVWNDDHKRSYRDGHCRVTREYKRNGDYRIERKCKKAHDYRYDRHRDHRVSVYPDRRPIIVIEPVIRIGG